MPGLYVTGSAHSLIPYRRQASQKRGVLFFPTRDSKRFSLGKYHRHVPQDLAAAEVSLETTSFRPGIREHHSPEKSQASVVAIWGKFVNDAIKMRTVELLLASMASGAPNHYNSFPAARSRIRPRSAARKSYSGRSSSRTHLNCWKIRFSSSPVNSLTAKNCRSTAPPCR